MSLSTQNVDALSFSRQWEAAWNRRDLEAVLAHFHDDAIFTSPVAIQIGFSDDGVIRGKAELRRYWTAALDVNAGLHFRINRVFVGVDVIVIAYSNQHGIHRAEVLTFRDGRVAEGRGAFGA